MSLDISRVVTAATFLVASAIPSAEAQERSPLTQLSESLEALSRRVSPSVVEVWVSALTTVGSGSSASLGRATREGSGVIVSVDGYILTNAHVVQGARELYVVLPRPAADDIPGRSILAPFGERVRAELLGSDQETDLAVLKIDAADLTAAELGDSDSLRAGNIVLAFGSPLGLESSVTMGVVSAVGRQLQDDHPMVYIQTDAPINPGNSGGPLVDTHGRVVGINTLIFSQSGGNEGIGFAAPSNIAQAVLDEITTHGRVRRGVIGINAQTITPMIAAGLRLPQSWGVIVADVYPRSPAAASGMRSGDVIVSLDGKIMENARQFDVNVYPRVGSVLSLGIRRGLQFMSVTVPVVERADDPARVADLINRERNLVPELGILALQMNEDILQMLPWVRQRSGVVVAARAAGSPRVNSRLEAGDVIYAVNGQAVATISQLSAQLQALAAGDAVVLHVDRRGQLRYLAFQRE